MNLHLNLVRPVNHADDYDRIIAMCEWTEDSFIELEDHEIDQYILDDWQWKQSFKTTNQMYTGYASPSKATL